MNRINIAIDGFSGCGKSTLARDLAESVGYTFVDTGAMYRAIALLGIENAMSPQAVISDAPTISFAKNRDILINGVNRESEIRSTQVANKVSEVASVPEVRAYLKSIQQDLIAQKGIVMEGRDITSVIMPEAEVKLFITAKLSVRSERRHKQLLENGVETSLDEVKENLLSRDQKDMERSEAPLVLNEGVLVLDTSNLTREEQLKCVRGIVDPIINPKESLGDLAPVV